MHLGLQVAYRTIEATCRVSAGLVGLPVQLAVVDETGGRELEPVEVNQVRDEVAGWMQLEAETLRGNGGVGAPEADELPTFDNAQSEADYDLPPGFVERKA